MSALRLSTWCEGVPLIADCITVNRAAMKPFTYNALPARVIFGWGTSSQVADEVKRLGCVSLFRIPSCSRREAPHADHFAF